MSESAVDSKADKRMARRIRRAYMLALSIIAFMTLGVFVIERGSMQRFSESATILNVAGKQRMLSQRIAIFSSDFARADNASATLLAAENIVRTKTEMADAYAWLLENATSFGKADHLTPDTHALYFSEPHNVDRRLREYFEKVNALLESDGDARKARNNAVYVDAIGPLVVSLDAAVSQLEQDAKDEVDAARRLRVALMITVLLVLFAEWFFIFRPLARMVQHKTKALEQAHEAVAHAAMHDPLTDLPNRRMLDTILETTLAQSYRLGKPLTICHLDLDQFKAVNDTLGHSVGDKVLLHATTVLRNATRASDFIARVGGDEFVIVDCTFGGYEGASVMAERIVERMARPFEVDGHICRIGASIGIAVHDPDDEDLEAIMHRADIALYHAKELGRGQVQPWSEDALVAFEGRLNQRAA